MERRAFLKLSFFTLVSLGLAACGVKPTELEATPTTIPAEPTRDSTSETPPYVDAGLLEYGRRIDGWQILNAVKMIEAFPQLELISRILHNQEDPREFFPFAKIPLTLSTAWKKQQKDAFLINEESGKQSGLVVIVKFPDKDTLILPTIYDLDVKLFSKPEWREQKNLDLALITSTLSHLADFSNISRLYVEQILESRGVTFTSLDPAAFIPPEDYVLSAICLWLYFQEARARHKHGFRDFFDKSSLVRHRSILLANWLLDYRTQYGVDPPEPSLVDQARNLIESLGERNIIEYNPQKGYYDWVSGFPPAINSELISLCEEIFGYQIQPFLSKPETMLESEIILANSQYLASNWLADNSLVERSKLQLI